MTGSATSRRVVAAPWSSALSAAIEQTQGNYRLRLARPDELDAVFALRFRVFNLELDEGLAAAYATERDEDGFDRQCHHLLVETIDAGDVVGTYRMQTRAMARAGAGFYSAAEFDIEALGERVLSRAVELGRACIDSEHRNTRVLYLLWRGLAAYMLGGGHRWFFGCCSLTSQDPLEGHRLYRRLAETGMLDPEHAVNVQPDYQCAGVDDGDAAPKLPKLMRLYLSYGARIASGPALDAEFGTIDYLALFDLESLNESHRRMFLEPA